MSADPNPEVAVAETEATEASEAAPKAKAAAKKPAKAEKVDKPFVELITEDLIPATLKAFAGRQVNDLELKLDGKTLIGTFDQGRRIFNILFAEESLDGKKLFACALNGTPPSTVESFMIDERKPGVDLIVFYILQRVYAQQWF